MEIAQLYENLKMPLFDQKIQWLGDQHREHELAILLQRKKRILCMYIPLPKMNAGSLYISSTPAAG
jgi:hypothetical protein